MLYRSLLPALFLLVSASSQGAEPLTNGAKHAEAFGWRLGVQTFCFYRIDFLETVERLKTIGVRYVEAFPGQAVGGAFPSVRFDHRMPPEARALVEQRLAEAGVILLNIGVVSLPNDEAACRQVFEFAKDMGVETIVSEPPQEALPMIDSLCAEYGIDMAIHNHPEPSAYWNPETVFAAIKDRSPRIGVCADTSHWMRSGVDVLKWLKRFEGRLKCFHFGDVQPDALQNFNAQKKRRIADGGPPTMVQHITAVPNAVYGEGAGEMRAWLAELRRQNVRALFCVEAFFELTPDQTQAKIAECVRWFDDTAKKLSND